jgi:hypothetical protein
MGKRGINMKNEIQNIISLIRANPKFVRLALTLDATVGIVFGLLAYVFMNYTAAEITPVFVYGLASALMLAAVGYVGYTVLYNTGYDFTDDEVEYEEGE